MLITGFGPFGSVTTNPSEMLAETAGSPFQVLEVSFEAVNAFLADLDPATFDQLLLIGVAATADRFRIETVARNEIGPTPDVRGEVWGLGPINPALPSRLGATLWRSPEFFVEDPRWTPSVDAGTYLCNFAFFRALECFRDKEVGFLHVPGLDKAQIDSQREWLGAILGLLDGGR